MIAERSELSTEHQLHRVPVLRQQVGVRGERREKATVPASAASWASTTSCCGRRRSCTTCRITCAAVSCAERPVIQALSDRRAQQTKRDSSVGDMEVLTTNTDGRALTPHLADQ